MKRNYLLLLSHFFIVVFCFVCDKAAAVSLIMSGLSAAEINTILSRVRPGERIVFEKESKYVVDEQLLFVGLTGNLIDFNGCTFTIEAGHEFIPKSFAGHYVGEVIIFL